MSIYEYWKCSEKENKEGFGVKNIKNNTYYAGDEVIDLINSLHIQLEECKKEYKNTKEKLNHYRGVLTDVIGEGGFLND